MRQATGARQGTTGVDWGHGTYGGRISAGPLSSCLACTRNRVVVANPLPSRVWAARHGGRPGRRRGGGDDPLRTVYKVLTRPGWNLRRRWNRLVGTRSRETAIGWVGEDHTAAVPHGSNPARPKGGSMKALAASASVILVAASYAAYQALGGGSTQVDALGSSTPSPVTMEPTIAAPLTSVDRTAPTAAPASRPPEGRAVAGRVPEGRRDRRGSEHEDDDDHGARPVSNAQPLRPNAVLAQPTTATPPTVVAPPTTVPQPAVAAQPTAAPKSATPINIPTIKPTLAPATGTRLRDGSYNSSVISTNWGPIEMKIVVSGGKITDVVALQYPSSRSRSLQISNYALPAYEDEVIRTQDEHVNSISGATQTARGFRAAIASAIQKAL